MKKNKELIGWRLDKDSMGGGGLLNVLYTDKRTAELSAIEKTEEWISYKAVKRTVRVLNDDEAADGMDLVRIDRTSAKEKLRASAMRKLTREEQEALMTAKP